MIAASFLASATTSHAAGLECAPRPESATGYQVAAVGADRITPPATTPPIAILDSGIASVPELADRIRPGANVVSGGQNTADLDGHGTAVATIAAGAAGGVRGVSPTTPLIPITIFDRQGQATADAVINGLKRAVKLGARVINLSASIPARASDPAVDRQVQDAIWSAVTNGAVVVAPTGNEGTTGLDIPAAYPHVLAVAATDEGGVRADYSNSGSGVDLAAPGSNITSAVPDFLCSSGYALVTGTSFAAPAVSAAAALVLADHPDFDAQQVADALRLHGVRSPAPVWNPNIGFGLLDVPAVLAAVAPPKGDGEVNDTVAWAKRHPAVLTPAKRSASIQGRLTPRFDPRDVFQLRLKRGDRIVASADDARSTLELSNGQRSIVRGASVRTRIKTGGNYYLAIAVKQAPAEGMSYAIRVRR